MSDIFAVHRSGKGPPLVLLHAVGLDLTWWSDVISKLPTDMPLAIIDLPGHGRSATPKKGSGFDSFARQILHHLDDAGIDSFHLCGHSIGGMIAQHLADIAPERILSLSLIATASTFPDETRIALRERATLIRTAGMAAISQPTIDRWFTEKFQATRPDVIERCQRTLQAVDAQVHAHMWSEIAELETAKMAKNFTITTQVIVGDEDIATPQICSRTIAEAVPQCDLHVLSGSSHMVTLDNPVALAELLVGIQQQ